MCLFHPQFLVARFREREIVSGANVGETRDERISVNAPLGEHRHAIFLRSVSQVRPYRKHRATSKVVIIVILYGKVCRIRGVFLIRVEPLDILRDQSLAVRHVIRTLTQILFYLLKFVEAFGRRQDECSVGVLFSDGTQHGQVKDLPDHCFLHANVRQAAFVKICLFFGPHDDLVRGLQVPIHYVFDYEMVWLCRADNFVRYF